MWARSSNKKKCIKNVMNKNRIRKIWIMTTKILDEPSNKEFLNSNFLCGIFLSFSKKIQQLSVRKLIPPCWFQTYNFILYANTFTFFIRFLCEHSISFPCLFINHTINRLHSLNCTQHRIIKLIKPHWNFITLLLL
jgi:hypothetical protein